MTDLTFRVKVGEHWRTVPEREFFLEVLALKERDFDGAALGPISIEAMDERGRLCWRAYYTGYRELARELMQDRKRVLDR